MTERELVWCIVFDDEGGNAMPRVRSRAGSVIDAELIFFRGREDLAVPAVAGAAGSVESVESNTFAWACRRGDRRRCVPDALIGWVPSSSCHSGLSVLA
jgi:hypothetical protein